MFNQFDEKYYRFPREHSGDGPEHTALPASWSTLFLRAFIAAAIATGLLMMVL